MSSPNPSDAENRKLRKSPAIVACASFKGTLSSRAAGQAIARGLHRAGIEAIVIALADGGEGLVEALISSHQDAHFIDTPARGPLGQPTIARIGVIGPASEATVVIEMAASSGLSLIAESDRNPRITSTHGVGDQIRAALDWPDLVIKNLLLGLGGSATNDAGAGMAQALGAKLLDIRGNELPPGGAALAHLQHIDIAGFDPRLKSIEITVACDVDNVLCGPSGASFVYGPQKGASPEDVALLDKALDNYATVIERDLGRDIRNIPGSGAAGGLGAGLLAFTNARMKPGIELVLDTLHFDALLDDASLVITGEGYLDSQTLHGKAPLGVARRAAKKNVACVAIAGDVDSGAQNELKQHFLALESLRAFAGSLERAKAEAAAMLEALAAQNLSIWLEQAESAKR